MYDSYLQINVRLPASQVSHVHYYSRFTTSQVCYCGATKIITYSQTYYGVVVELWR